MAIWGINFCYSEGRQISRSETRPFVVTLKVSNSPIEKERGKHRGPRTLTRPFDLTKYVDGRRGGLFTTTPRKLHVYETVRTRSDCYVRFIYLLIQTVCRTSVRVTLCVRSEPRHPRHPRSEHNSLTRTHRDIASRLTGLEAFYILR